MTPFYRNACQLRENEAIAPGLFLNRLCPDIQSLKARKQEYLTSWANLSGSDQPHLADAARALQERRADSLEASTQAAEHWQGQVAWRAVVGLSGPNALETGVTLHPIYGIPIIAGSALKGVAKQWRLQSIGEEIGVFPLADEVLRKRRDANRGTPLELLEALLFATDDTDARELLALLQRDEAVTLALAEYQTLTSMAVEQAVTRLELPAFQSQYGESFRRVFGTTDCQGDVTFLPALPVTWNYEVDVITPHYAAYYTGEAFPADWLSPTPVPFLAVREGSIFHFDLYGETPDVVDDATSWLTQTLADFGVGAKTHGGYGRFLF